MTTVPPSPAQGETAGVARTPYCAFCDSNDCSHAESDRKDCEIAALRQQLAEARADATLADERWMRDGERRDKAEQQLAEMRGALEMWTDSHGIVGDPPVRCRCTACKALVAALAPTSPDPVRSAGEAVPERGKRETPTSEEKCPKRDDGLHCNCWYDGEVCCSCGDAPAEEPDKGYCDRTCLTQIGHADEHRSLPIERPGRCPKCKRRYAACAQGESLADPERQGVGPVEVDEDGNIFRSTRDLLFAPLSLSPVPSPPPTDDIVAGLRAIAHEALNRLDRLHSMAWDTLTFETKQQDVATLRRAIAELSERGWQPIETAPLDGTAVLIYCEGWRDGSEAHFIPDHGWYLENVDHTDNHGRAFYPTHWQKLPAPPPVCERGK